LITLFVFKCSQVFFYFELDKNIGGYIFHEDFSFSFWFRITINEDGILIKVKYQDREEEDALLKVEKLFDYYRLIVTFQGKDMQSESLLKYYSYYSIQIVFVNHVVKLLSIFLVKNHVKSLPKHFAFFLRFLKIPHILRPKYFFEIF
jgi:hypothetical protein